MNRFNPGATRPDYANAAQPIRNSDLANLSVSLLGLPLVPGALMAPELEKPLTPEWSDGMLVVKWPAYLTGWTLEASGSLQGTSWVPVTEGVTLAGGTFVHTVGNPVGKQFFRLRRPSAP